MKLNYTLLWITIIFIFINILLAWDMSNCTGGTSLIYVLIFPLFWGITLVIVGVLSYIKRKVWFQEQIKFSTIILIFLCTPFLPLVYSKITEPDIVRSGTSYFTQNREHYRRENYVYYNIYKQARIEFWVRDNAQSSLYLKDSIWVYFDRNGDTLKKVHYNRGIVMKVAEREE